MRLATLLAVLFLCTVATACGHRHHGGGGTSPPPPPAVNLTGLKTGTATTNGVRRGCTLDLVQSGANLRGTWRLTTPAASGTLTGTVSGTDVAFALVETSPAAGSFSGTAVAEPSTGRLVGSFSGADAVGAVSGSFDVR